MVDYSLFACSVLVLGFRILIKLIVGRAAEPTVLELPQQSFAQGHVAVHELTRVIQCF